MLLDLHSFTAPGVPFVFLGPRRQRRPARAVRAGRARGGAGGCDSASAAPSTAGSSTYAAGTARRRELAALHPDATLDLDPRYGIGTTEYMRSVGGCAVTLECGQHDDPQAPQVAYRAIVNTLAHLGLIEAADPAPAPQIEALRLCEVVDRLHADDAFAQGLAQLRSRSTPASASPRATTARR